MPDVAPDLAPDLGGATTMPSVGTAILVAISGKSCSGKDAVADGIAQAFGGRTWARLTFGDGVKQEVQRLVSAVAASADKGPAALAVARDLGVSPEDADRAVRMLWSAVREHGLTTTRVRHPALRPVYQYWGGMRVAKDPGHWLNRTAAKLAEQRQVGASVLLTDVRLPEEARWARDEGFLLIRLDVPEAVRRARALRRDGRPPSHDVENDRTETALDEYPDFHLRLDNSGELAPVLAAITAALRAWAVTDPN